MLSATSMYNVSPCLGTTCLRSHSDFPSPSFVSSSMFISEIALWPLPMVTAFTRSCRILAVPLGAISSQIVVAEPTANAFFLARQRVEFLVRVGRVAEGAGRDLSYE